MNLEQNKSLFRDGYLTPFLNPLKSVGGWMQIS